MRFSFWHCAAAVAIFALAGGPGLADDPPAGQPAVTLEFTPAADFADSRTLKVTISEVLLTEAPTGLTGQASAAVEVSTKEADPQGQFFVMRVDLSKVSQQMAGRNLAVTPPGPVALKLDRRARLLEIPAQELPPVGEILSQGGVPLQAIAVICGIPQLPEEPVAPGGTWMHEETWAFPGLGEVKLQAASVLVGMNGNLAAIKSNVRLIVPDFEADHPLMPGQKVQVHNLTVDFTDLAQDYDTVRSVVCRAEGKVNASLEARSPDIVLPVRVVAGVQYIEPGAANP